MSIVKYKNIKWGVYTSPQSGKNEFEMYVIETIQDLNNFVNVYPQIRNFNVFESMTDCINRGDVVLANDAHHLTNFPTWCIESDQDDKHPSAFIRIKLGEIQK